MGYTGCWRYRECAIIAKDIKKFSFHIPRKHRLSWGCVGDMIVSPGYMGVMKEDIMQSIFIDLREHLIDDISILIMVYLDDN